MEFNEYEYSALSTNCTGNSLTDVGLPNRLFVEWIISTLKTAYCWAVDMRFLNKLARIMHGNGDSDEEIPNIWVSESDSSGTLDTWASKSDVCQEDGTFSAVPFRCHPFAEA